FAALGIGSWLMQNGPTTEWYLQLNKAPWTPPGWIFGVAWITIMFCFSFYMTFLYEIENTAILKLLFVLQVLLNVSWNYIFFNKQSIGGGLLVIIMLTLVVFYLLITYFKALDLKNLFILPYGIWLMIATSLNLYIYLKN
ncbi:MAG: tryptophan-rich sensory protein, partial [Flavobacteriaceae bacterium]|nr:tryptophan-rich sensory protein [Flavobacteriaceae bacterium]